MASNPINFSGLFYDVNEPEIFRSGLSLIKNSIASEYVTETVSCADNMITWGRSYSFLREDFFQNFVRNSKYNQVTKSRIWRMHIAIQMASFLSELRYFEIGTGLGDVADLLVDRFKGERGSIFSLWDRSFIVQAVDISMLVEKRFLFRDNVQVSSGKNISLYEAYKTAQPNFVHLLASDEIDVVEFLSVINPDVMPKVMLLDWYGWSAYLQQKDLFDVWCDQNGLNHPVELPTGQGLMINFRNF